LPKQFSPSQLEILASEDDHLLDAMYVAFEDRFRGTREDIKGRQKVYLPYVEKVLQETEGGPVLDVGCGRGEWLELLVEHGYTAKGVDLNRIMVAQSRELGLDVDEGDVFDYFSGISSDSLCVVTGFHIVEHLPLKTLISLFDQVFRVLKPGGMVLFETPNPENIIVGSCNFYYDPTHRNPIPPDALKFLLEARGYQDLEIIRLHENNMYADLKESDISEKITSRFFGAQDYSVIGYKR
jgi:O-antigen chain-terminating methyltransferase